MKYFLLVSLIGLSIPAIAMEETSHHKKILMQAAKTGNTDVIEWLYSPESGILIDVDTKNEEGLTPLHLASMRNHPETVLKLIEIGAQLDTRTSLGGDIERRMHFLDAMGLNINQSNGPTPLHLARSLEVVALLVVHGANIDAAGPLGGPPLFPAILFKHKEIVQFLLEQGADAEHQNIDGTKLLAQAILIGNQEIVQLLVDNGANIHDVGNGRSALFNATVFGDLPIVSLLLSQGADINETGCQGETLLHVAAFGVTRSDAVNQAAVNQIGQSLQHALISNVSLPSSDHKGLIAYLLDNGLDVFVTRSPGTALHAAAIAGKQELCETLLRGAAYAHLKKDSEENYQRIYCVLLCFHRLHQQGRGIQKDLYVIIFSYLGQEVLSGAINTATLESFYGDIARRCKKTFGLNYPSLILLYCVEPARKLLALPNERGQTAADVATALGNGPEELPALLDPAQSDDTVLQCFFEECSNTEQTGKGKEEEE